MEFDTVEVNDLSRYHRKCRWQGEEETSRFRLRSVVSVAMPNRYDAALLATNDWLLCGEG